MAAKKEVKGVVKLVVPAKQANPAPPIGPALGAWVRLVLISQNSANSLTIKPQTKNRVCRFRALSRCTQTAVLNLL